MHPKASPRADDSFTFLEQHGGDLSHYDEALSLERAKRTNGMRKIFSGSKNIVKHSSSMRSISKLLDSDKPNIDIPSAIETYTSSDTTRIIEFSNNLINCAENTPNRLKQLLKSEEFLRVLVNSLGIEYPKDEVFIALIRTINSLFDLYDEELQEELVDEGLCLYLMNMFASENIEIVTAALFLAITIGSSSSYGRDAVLSFGLHTSLIEIAKNQMSEDVTVLACRCLRTLFSTDGDIDSTILVDCIDPVIELMQIPSKKTMNEVIECLIEMTNKMASLIYRFFEIGITGQIIGLLDDTDLQGVALKLIGNMSVSQPAQIKEMLSFGLVNKLSSMSQSPYVSDVLWILSNLIESVPNLIIPLFNIDFIQQLITLSNTCNSEVKREIAFLFATLIIFSPSDVVLKLMIPEIIGILVEMVGCGCSMVTLRCLDSIVAFIRIINITEKYDFVNLLLDEDIQDRINDLLEYNDPPILERAEFINLQITNFQNKM